MPAETPDSNLSHMYKYKQLTSQCLLMRCMCMMQSSGICRRVCMMEGITLWQVNLNLLPTHQNADAVGSTFERRLNFTFLGVRPNLLDLTQLPLKVEKFNLYQINRSILDCLLHKLCTDEKHGVTAPSHSAMRIQQTAPLTTPSKGKRVA